MQVKCEFSPINFILSAGSQLLDLRLSEKLSDAEAAQLQNESLIKFVSEGACAAVRHGWDYSQFLSESPEFTSFFEDAQYDADRAN